LACLIDVKVIEQEGYLQSCPACRHPAEEFHVDDSLEPSALSSRYQIDLFLQQTEQSHAVSAKDRWSAGFPAYAAMISGGGLLSNKSFAAGSFAIPRWPDRCDRFVTWDTEQKGEAV
jgi:hypothetical protein